MTEPAVCERCGTPHFTWRGRPACAGHHNDTGLPCKNPPRLGLAVCGYHGASKKAIAAGKRRVSEAKAAVAMRTFGGPVETTATEALLDTVKWTAGYVAWLREAVAKLDTSAITWGISQQKTGGEDWGVTSKAGANAYVVLLGEWTDRLVRVCKAAIDAGIEERRVRIAEGQGALVAEVIRAVLGDLELTAEQAAKVPEIVPRRLRLLAGGAA